MKKILILTLCLFAGSVMAQELFPELAGMGGRTKTVEKKVAAPATPAPTKALDEDDLPPIAPEVGETETNMQTQQDETVGTATEEANLFDTPEKPADEPVEAEDEEEEEEDESQRITVYLADAKSTITPNRDFSYCFGVLKFLNTLKKPVQALSFTLKYGNLKMDYSTSLQPKQEQTGSIALVGTACEHIMDMPEITFKKCVVEGLSEKACWKKFEFLPLRGE